MVDTLQVSAQCHCTKQTFHVQVPLSSLPLQNEMCHCWDCRHITGMLAGDFVELPELEKDVFDPDCVPSGLSVYKKPGGRVSWYFCKECGTHLLQSAPPRDGKGGRTNWLFSMGTFHPLELPDGTKTTRRSRHSFVNYEEHDGGLARYILDGIPHHLNGSDERLAVGKAGQTGESQAEIERAASADVLPFRCHCGHVQIRVHRPSYAPVDKEWQSTVKGENGQAWVWNFCFCNSCRATSGFDVTSVLFAPYTHITTPTPGKHPTDGLSLYVGHPERQRHFCPTCGACALFDDTGRGDLSDVFLGLADVPLAALFSNWIRQERYISFWSYAKNKELAESLARGYCPEVDMEKVPKDNGSAGRIMYDGTLRV